MPTDQEYLATAGVADENAQGSQVANTEDNVPRETAAPAEGQAPQTPQEFFELNGNKFPSNTEFRITHGGKILNVPYSKLANTYRQAEHLNDKFSQFKKQQEEWQTKYADAEKWKGFYDKYGQLQSWSEQNPQEWERLWNLYQNKDQHLLKAGMAPQDPNAPQTGQNFDPLLNAFAEFKKATEEKLSKYDQYVQQMEQQQAEQQQTADMDFIKNQVWEFQKSYQEINLDEKDPDGLPLWAKVMQWGVENSVPDFDLAAQAYLKDRIADVISTRARTEAMRGLKGERQAGIIAKSNTPIMNKGTQGQGAAFSYQKGKSYGQLADEAKDLLMSGGM